MPDNTPNGEQAQLLSMPRPPGVSSTGASISLSKASSKPVWNGDSPEPWIQAGFPQPKEVRRRVDALYASLDYDVDLIPPSWDLEIRREKSGRSQPDLEAQRVLAFLLTWHRTGAVGRGRFSGRGLQVSWKLLETRFSMKRKAVSAVLKRLDDEGLIHRDSGPRGEGQGAYLFIAPNMDRVEAITYPVAMSPATGELRRAEDGDPFSGSPYYRSCVRTFELSGLSLATLLHDEGVRILTLRHPKSFDAPIEIEGPVGETSVPYASSGDQGASFPTDSSRLPVEEWTPAPDFRGEGAYSPTDPLSGYKHDVRDLGTDLPLDGQLPPPDDEHLDSILETAREVRTNVSASASVHDADRRIERQVKALAESFHHSLRRAGSANARRAIARRAWLTAGRLQPNKRITRAIANAWDRLERHGHDPALTLVDLAVFACGRIHGVHEHRRRTCVWMLNAVCRKGACLDLLHHELEEDALQTALRTALKHRLDRDNLPSRIARLCADQQPTERQWAFATALVEAYSSPTIPCHDLLFAGAMASCIRDHDRPTATDLFDACWREARSLGYVPIPEGSSVLVDEELWLDADDRPIGFELPGAESSSDGVRIVDAVWSGGATRLELGDGGTIEPSGLGILNPTMEKAEWLAGRC